MAAKRHIYAVFEQREAAYAAYSTVQERGCASEHCSAILHERDIESSLDPAGERAGREGAIDGAAIGGVVGAVVGGAVAIVGGVAVMPVAAAVVGGSLLAGYGALAGSIAASDEPEKHLRELEEALNEGKLVIAIETDDPELRNMCEDVFQQYGGQIVVGQTG
jgi:hypothetical protein